jgi:hypothetical protein
MLQYIAMKKFSLILLLAFLATGLHAQTQRTFRNCRQVLDSTLCTSPYVKDLVLPWEQQIKAAGGLGWDHVLESGPSFNDQDPMSGNSYSEDYIFLLRATYKDSASAVYTFKIKPSNGKLFELDKASNMWMQRKSDPALMPIVVSLCK